MWMTAQVVHEWFGGGWDSINMGNFETELVASVIFRSDTTHTHIFSQLTRNLTRTLIVYNLLIKLFTLSVNYYDLKLGNLL